jgi:iron-sulfur cluster repair protein YtfE (RIC family)
MTTKYSERFQEIFEEEVRLTTRHDAVGGDWPITKAMRRTLDEMYAELSERMDRIEKGGTP